MSTETVEKILPSEFQKRVLGIPEGTDVFLGGGRGGGKSFAMALLILRHIELHQEKARVLVVRKTYRSLADFELVCRKVFAPAGASYNVNDHVWRFPQGGYIELGHLDGPRAYEGIQGRSFSEIYVDEAGMYASPVLVDQLRSNLRADAGVPVRMVLAANPGSVGTAWLSRRYVTSRVPWQPFVEDNTGQVTVYCPSVYTDNEYLDHDDYRGQLEAACSYDPALLNSWLTGSWAGVAGAFFAHVLDEKRSAFGPWTPEEAEAFIKHRDNDAFLAHDYGVSAPSVTYVCVRSGGLQGPDGRFYPKGSLLLLDELATVVPGSSTVGLQWTLPKLAEAIKELAGKWGISPEGVGDDAMFANHGHAAGSIADEFEYYSVRFKEARKGDRATGWEVMRKLLQQAGEPDVPGLYVSRDCAYWLETVPFLERDPRKLNDVRTDGPDHAADACRYACFYEKPGFYAGESPF